MMMKMSVMGTVIWCSYHDKDENHDDDDDDDD